METVLLQAEAQLLKTPIKSLDCSVEQAPFLPWVHDILCRLRRRGIHFEPRLWAAEEWYVPEGVPGIAIPFSLFHPAIARLQRRHTGECEGLTEACFKKVFTHELGHALEEAFRLSRHPLRTRVFGSTDQPYPRKYWFDPSSKDYVVHLPNGYAQAHPDEDFAETFAVWLGPKKKWREKYKKWPVALAKLEAMDQLMGLCKVRPVKKRPNFRPPCSASMRGTVGSYIARQSEKAQRYRLASVNVKGKNGPSFLPM